MGFFSKIEDELKGAASKLTDDILGLDPGGGGIYNIPVIGDVVDKIGFDPGNSPLNHLGRLAAIATGGTLAAGALGAGPATGLFGGGVGAGGTAAAAAHPLATGATGATAATGGGLGATLGTVGSTLGNIGSKVGSAVLKNPGLVADGLSALGAAGVGGGGSGGAGGSSSNPLWDAQAPYITPTFDIANAIYNEGAPEYFPDSTVAALDPTRAEGLGLTADAARGDLTDLSRGQTDLLTGILGGTDAGTQRLAQQAAQATGGAFGQSGTFGGARHAQAANNAAAQTILNRQLDAANQVSNAQLNAARPGETLANVGGVYQDQDQREIDAAKERYDYEANLPSTWLKNYHNNLNPAGISAPNVTTPYEPTDLEKAAGWLSLGTGAYNAYKNAAQGGEIRPMVKTRGLLR